MARQHRLICDTNIWYDLYAGTITWKELTKWGGRPCIAPFSIAEIVGGLSLREYLHRKEVCKAILAAGPTLLPDEEALVSGGSVQPEWEMALQAVVKSDSYREDVMQLYLGKDVVDFNIVKFLNAWRRSHEVAWMRGVARAVAATCPADISVKYLNAMANPNLRFPPTLKVSTTTMNTYLSTQESIGAFDQAMQMRFAGLAKFEEIECYLAVYKRYLTDLVCKPKKPLPNDHLDHQLFMYAIDNWHIITTRDTVWQQYVEEAGFAHRLRKL